ncbi:MAG: sulfatase [Phycisphaerales bacterium]|jgi:arylsulfatase A|nr:sulfatase [Phycisphaerales bacterium]MBT7170846.1 sulfatase [Phycisphaerales bacterium]
MMQRRNFLRATALGSLGVMAGCKGQLVAETPKPAVKKKLNVVLIFTDDQGYGDLSCFGAKDLATPHIDSIAKRGLKLTDFYVPCTVCTPSRAALLTGAYPKRIGLHEVVLFPESKHGLNPKEELLPELLKRAGYATGMFGKWHLGHHKTMMPNAQGFDEYFGVPYSNDMAHVHKFAKYGGKKPDNSKLPAKFHNYPKLPLLHNGKVLELEPDQCYLTKRYTEKACEFITANKDKPFFVYLPHSMPHVPLYRSKAFEGSSKRGVYGDVIQELDWGVGEVLKTLKTLGLEKDTLVIYTSDNGGGIHYKYKGAVNAPLRGGKANTWDGGSRVPCVMQLPGVLPEGKVCKEMLVSFDLVPTICNLVGAPLPKAKIDGRDILPILTNPEKTADPRPLVLYCRNGNPECIRYGKWKLHVAKRDKSKGPNGLRKGEKLPFLFDLRADIGETKNVAKQNPAVVKKLRAMMNKINKEITANARPVARVKTNLVPTLEK